MSGRGPLGGARRRALRRLARRDVLTTREGWVVDLAGPQRIDAVRVLAREEGAEVERALVDALADPLDEVRAEVVLALHARQSAAGAQRCAAGAAGWEHHRYPLSRSRAWAYLRDCAGPEDAAPLTGALLLAEGSPAVDPVALDALEQAIGGDAGVRARVLEHALGVLDDDDAAVVARARQISIRIAANDPAPVSAVLDDDRRAPVAARVLGEIGDLRSTSDLGALLSPARPVAVRAAGAAALGALGGQRAARILAAHVDDSDPTVRRAATDALAPLAGLLALEEEEPGDDGDALPHGGVDHEAAGPELAEEPAAPEASLDDAEESTASPEVAPSLGTDVSTPDHRESDPSDAEPEADPAPVEVTTLSEMPPGLADAPEEVDEAAPVPVEVYAAELVEGAAPEPVEADAPEPVDEAEPEAHAAEPAEEAASEEVDAAAPEPVEADAPEEVDEAALATEPEPQESQHVAGPVAVVVDAAGPTQTDAPQAARNGAAVADIAAAAEEVQALAQAEQAERAVVEPDPPASPEAAGAATDADDVEEAAHPAGNGHADPAAAAAAVERFLADDSDAPWTRSTGPVPAGPPPRPRGAKRSRRRR